MTTPFSQGEPDAVWWIGLPGNHALPLVTAYRLVLDLKAPLKTCIHVSADQRYILYLDGKRIGRGPERGDKLHWYYETYALSLDTGSHSLVAQVWSLRLEDREAPKAQISVQPGFVLTADEPERSRFATGIAAWETLHLDGYSFIPSTLDGLHIGFIGSRIDLDGNAFPWDFASYVVTPSGVIPPGEPPSKLAPQWQPARRVAIARDSLNGRFWGDIDYWRLTPATLPPMLDRRLTTCGAFRHLDSPAAFDARDHRISPAKHISDESESWQRLLAGTGSVTIPPNTSRRAIVDLNEYYCAYPELTLSGGAGAAVRIAWAESLFEVLGFDGVKGNRNEIAGKVFFGFGDIFRPDGADNRIFRTLWWGCGRYIELSVKTGSSPITLQRLDLFETRYPLEREGRLTLSEPRFAPAESIMWRSLQMCAHETYMDCPYHEQLQYAGDTRLQMLVTYVTTRDDRLPRKAIAIMQASQLDNGQIQARYPGNGGQIIPQFSLFWIGMVYDYALWRGNRDFVRNMLPGVRAVMEAFIAHIGANGLLRTPEGWDFVDWVPAWQQHSGGQATLDATGLSGINHLLFIYIAGLASELEHWAGEAVLAERLESVRRQLMDRTRQTFWDPARKLFADTPSRDSFSEHAQSLACLTGLMSDTEMGALHRGLIHATDLARATVYFQHYLFEAFHVLGRTDAILDRMGFWYGLTESGLKTCIERPEPSRSDCHAWGAHPLYHAYASLLGIRPAGLGSKQLLITPSPSGLEHIEGAMPHPAGLVSVRVARKSGQYAVTVDAPKALDVILSHVRINDSLPPGRTAPLKG